MVGVDFGTAEVVFEGRLEDCLMSKLWQDPECAHWVKVLLSPGCTSVCQY